MLTNTSARTHASRPRSIQKTPGSHSRAQLFIFSKLANPSKGRERCLCCRLFIVCALLCATINLVRLSERAVQIPATTVNSDACVCVAHASQAMAPAGLVRHGAAAAVGVVAALLRGTHGLQSFCWRATVGACCCRSVQVHLWRHRFALVVKKKHAH